MQNLFGFLWSLVTLDNYLRVVAYLAPMTFLFYVVLMAFKDAEARLTPELELLGKVLLFVGMLHNASFNWLVATVLFFDPPREVTTTSRLNRYWMVDTPTSWLGRARKRLALFIRHRLDPFDARGIHQ